MDEVDAEEAGKSLERESQIESGGAKPGTKPRKTREAGDEVEARREEPKAKEIEDAKEGERKQQRQASRGLDIDLVKGANQERVREVRSSMEPGAGEGTKSSASVTS